MRIFIFALLLAPFLAAHAQPRVVPVQRQTDDIGSWQLSCFSDPMTDRKTCTLQHRLWIEEPQNGVGGLRLEVLNRHSQLVPALAVRNLTVETAMRGLMALTATAQVRFDGNPMMEFPCGLEGRAVVCAPRADQAVAAGAQLAAANTVLIRIRATGPFPTQGPTEAVALDLDQTSKALERALGQIADSTPRPGTSWTGGDMMEMFDRLRNLGEQLQR